MVGSVSAPLPSHSPTGQILSVTFLVSLTTNLREATFQGDLFGPTVSEDFVHRCGEQMSGWRSIFAMEALRASHIVNRPGSSEPHRDLLSCTLVD